MLRRNIININEIKGFIQLLSVNNPDWSVFIKGSVFNYLTKKAPLENNNFYWLKRFDRKKTANEKLILKNGGPYHYLKIDVSLKNRILNLIDFLDEHKASYINKQSIGFDSVERLHQKWVNKLTKRSSGEEGTIDIMLVFDDKFSIVKLIDEKSYAREGAVMKHCVASYSGRTDSKIYSLRDTQNQPIVTFEEKGGLICQISEKQNASISSENKHYLNKFAKMHSLKFGRLQIQQGNNLIYSVLKCLCWIFMVFNGDKVVGSLLDFKQMTPIVVKIMPVLFGIVSITSVIELFMNIINGNGVVSEKVKDQI
jgi:hypothetical protein